VTTTPLRATPVRSALELTARWSDLLEPPIFGARSLRLTWMAEDGVQLPLLMPIDDLPRLPEPALVEGLRTVHDAVVEKTGSDPLHLAMALCRPGDASVHRSDVAWSEALRTGVGDRIDGTWSLHLAAAGTVTPVVNPPLWTWL
jgi:hypothetical protein